MSKADHQLINQDSGNVEIYTPASIIAAARRTLGSIDLDPASCPLANKTVKASRILSARGLETPWSGRVWMNHPFGKKSAKTGHPGNAAWIDKLVSEYEAGNVTAACCICFASTSEIWFKPLLTRPQCFLTPRTNYILPDGSIYRGATKGSVVTYFGDDLARFANEFQSLGVIKVPYYKF